jgi:adenylate cyclase
MDDELTASTLAARSSTTPERIRQLAELRLIGDEAGHFEVGDVHRVRLVLAFEAAGVPAEALARASAAGTISLDFYDRLHRDPGAYSDRTFADLETDAGGRAALLRRVLRAAGLAVPGPRDRLSAQDEALLLSLLDALEANDDPDLVLRALHVFGDAARRASGAALSVFQEAVARAGADLDGVPPEELYDRFLEPWARFARLVPELASSLHARHLSAEIDAWSVAETERLLADSGFVAPRVAEEPAVAFVDLTAFTSLTEHRGDEAAASIAVAFADLAGEVVERGHGRVVKQLGDGVLVRFPDALAGVEASLDLLDALEASTLPSGHAGIEAGPLIVREGDVFGRTVNRASRIADVAEAGQLLASEDIAGRLPSERIDVEPAGTAALQGLDGPSRLVRLSRA